MNVQFAYEVSFAEPTRLTIQWDEGTPFNVELQHEPRVKTRLDRGFEPAHLLYADQRHYSSYAEFLKNA
ncbi:MAG TPA: hypothetical protein VH255_10995 [Verrucomicrobiae bacterium]|nr:hypothetical protein [Verrucomicrobiae bacterium]